MARPAISEERVAIINENKIRLRPNKEIARRRREVRPLHQPGQLEASDFATTISLLSRCPATPWTHSQITDDSCDFPSWLTPSVRS
jgi:hypothetical protein